MAQPPSRPEARRRFGSQSASKLGAPVASSIPEQLRGREPASARKGYEDALVLRNQRVEGSSGRDGVARRGRRALRPSVFCRRKQPIDDTFRLGQLHKTEGRHAQRFLVNRPTSAADVQLPIWEQKLVLERKALPERSWSPACRPSPL